MADTLAALDLIIGAQTKEFDKAFGKIDKKLSKFQKNVNTVGASLAGVFAASQVFDFGRQVLDITAKFQKYEAVLTNSLGSQQEAVEAMTLIRDIASQTPFQVDGLTNSYIKLVNRGIKPTREEIVKLGDLAASQGKDFDQLVEAQLDAQTGEFERLKEFGIKASKSGDQVKFTFKGVETQVKFTEDAIKNYIIGLGEVEGVSGGMAAISETLAGKLSNLDKLFLTIGQGNTGIMATSVDLIGQMVDGVTELANIDLTNLEKLIAITAAPIALASGIGLPAGLDAIFRLGGKVPDGADGPNPFEIPKVPGLKLPGSDGGSIEEVVLKVKEGLPIFEEFKEKIADLRIETRQLGSTMGVIPEKLGEIDVAITDNTLTSLQELQLAVMDAADSFEEMAIAGDIAFDNLLGSAREFTIEFIRLQLAQATSAAIKNAFKNANPLVASGVAIAGVAAVNSLFKKFVTPIDTGRSSVSSSSLSSSRRPTVGKTHQTVKIEGDFRLKNNVLLAAVKEAGRRCGDVCGEGLIIKSG